MSTSGQFLCPVAGVEVAARVCWTGQVTLSFFSAGSVSMQLIQIENCGGKSERVEVQFGGRSAWVGPRGTPWKIS